VPVPTLVIPPADVVLLMAPAKAAGEVLSFPIVNTAEVNATLVPLLPVNEPIEPLKLLRFNILLLVKLISLFAEKLLGLVACCNVPAVMFVTPE